MPKLKSHSRRTDKTGLNYVTHVFEDLLGADVDKIPNENDFGFDFYVNFVENGNIDDNLSKLYIPIPLRVQLKSGNSFFKNEDNEKFFVSIRKKDIDIWRDSSTPVLLVIYKKSVNKAYWINIRKYIHDKGSSGEKNLKVEIYKSAELNRESYDQILKILYEEQKGLPSTFIKIYKPIFDFLLGKYNTEDLLNLEKFQNEFEKDKTNFQNNNLTVEKVELKIDFALSQRRLYSLSNAISNLEILERSISSNKLSNLEITYSKVLYFLTVLYLEDNKIQQAKEILSRLENYRNNFTKKNKVKINLIKSMVYDRNDEINQAINNYEIVLQDPKIRKVKILIGVINLMCGVLCRRLDFYQRAKPYFDNSLKFLEIDSYLLAVAKSNVAALFYLNEDYKNSSKYYGEALELFEKTGDFYAISKIYKNLSSVKDDENQNFFGNSYDLFRRSVRLIPKNEFEQIQSYNYDGNIYLSEEIFERIIKKSKDFSYDYNEGIIEFEKAISLCDHIGDLHGKRNSLYQYGKYLSVIGKLSKNFNLICRALSCFVLTNYEEGIKSLSFLGIKNEDRQIFKVFLEWINKIEGDRLSELGRLEFYKYFSDFIPDSDIKYILKLILRSEKKGYSFYSSFDYGRKAITALNEFTPVLKKHDLDKILPLVLKNIKSRNRFIFEENLNLLRNINYQLLDEKEMKNIMEVTRRFLPEYHMKEKVYSIWQQMIIKTKNKTICEYSFNLLTDEIGKNEKENYHNEYKYLSASIYKRLRKKRLNEKIISEFSRNLKLQIQSASDNSYGILIGNTDAELLTFLYPYVSKNLQNKIIEVLTDFISSEQLKPHQRANALRYLFNLKLNKNHNLKYFENILKKIVKNPYTKYENRYFEENFFTGDVFDYKKMQAYALLLLVKINLKNLNFSVHNLLKLFNQNLKDDTKISVIDSLGKLALLTKNSNQYVNIIATYLLISLSEKNNRIIVLALYYLSKIVKRCNKEILLSYEYNVSRLINSENQVVKQQIAFNIKNFSANKGIISETLKKDISWAVRNQLSK